MAAWYAKAHTTITDLIKPTGIRSHSLESWYMDSDEKACKKTRKTGVHCAIIFWKIESLYYNYSERKIRSCPAAPAQRLHVLNPVPAPACAKPCTSACVCGDWHKRCRNQIKSDITVGLIFCWWAESTTQVQTELYPIMTLSSSTNLNSRQFRLFCGFYCLLLYRFAPTKKKYRQSELLNNPCCLYISSKPV